MAGPAGTLRHCDDVGVGETFTDGAHPLTQDEIRARSCAR